MSTRAYRTWLERIESGTFSEGSCRAWVRTVVPIASGEDAWGTRTTLTRDEATDLVKRMDARRGVALTREHADKGTAWLRRYGVKRGLPAWAVDEFDRFTFHGETFDVSTYGYRPQYAPVYRIHTRDGRTLDYVATPWQSGAWGGATRDVWYREGPRDTEDAPMT